jgi:hypothetical protein
MSKPDPSVRQSIGLSKLATFFAVAFGLAFGLCTVGTMTTRTINDHLITTALVIEVICILGLIVTAVIVICRALRGDY